jgi:hypothetical protein
MLCVPIGTQWPKVWLGVRAAERGSLYLFRGDEELDHFGIDYSGYKCNLHPRRRERSWARLSGHLSV